ncbi:segregation/condensation protein A [Allofranklinella schreckenbergeri]|uniref:Segregation and condensation protein A n=1 Tax=Allofranklinella schreckenbergeri TaxID=1076744 RepID=A0A3M6Q6M7_9BURK|nr:ScpA family protein [Allofranklinella schreckenbergeri]RMW98805.1 segregation/condensation protein A [Allofranklinella schreckenbergeri]
MRAPESGSEPEPERAPAPAPEGEDAADVAQAAALARLYGEPLFELPADLYIPPDALEVFLEAFEGPLDLLLYLIRKQNFNILDIPMVPLTQQYMGYVQEIRERNLELAAEYLLMAAMLIEIKSRMLLPRPPAVQEEEAEDPRAQLVRRLLEYEKTKLAAQALHALPQQGRDFWLPHAHFDLGLAPVLPRVEPEDLRRAWLAIVRRSKLVAHHTITREKLSVREFMSQVLRDLRGKPYVPFEDLFDPRQGLPVLVVTFIAMLELAKETLIEITQAEAFAPIYVVVRHQADPADLAEQARPEREGAAPPEPAGDAFSA